jgi:mono/diheme cytochrome c family protein
VRRALWWIALAGCGTATAAEPEPAAAPDAAALYDRYCLACHGSAGKGNGPAALWLSPPPRDFTAGDFKWRTTASGTPPTDADLTAAIRIGVPGTSMHAFSVGLTDADVTALIDIVKSFAPKRFERPPSPLQIGAPPAVDDAMLARGKQVYADLGCPSCHGDGGKGDGPSAATLKPAPPYDLTARPMRRPGGGSLEAIYTSLATGLDGTPMPSYAGTVSDADLWAVSAFVDTFRWRDGALPDPTTLELAAVRAATPGASPAGYWPGDPDSPDAIVWGAPIDAHGEPPSVLAPAQASLQPAQCGRCHAKQLREWRGSLHSKTASPGTLGQVARRNAAGKKSCLRCHAPLPEQLETSGVYDETLRDEGIACAACHVRGWTRYGPPAIPDARLLAQKGYPFQPLPIYERSDFCLPCHQLPPWNVKLVADAKDDRSKRKPLLNTYREWLEGPYMRRGIQCQHCHMPNREHTFLGIHDPDTFRQGVKLEAIAGRSKKTGAVNVRARLTNIGAGHYLPTTPTPAAWLDVELVDAGGDMIAGAADSQRIGRHLTYDGKLFTEVEDTRIPPDESLELARAWTGGRVPDAKWAVVRVRVAPDDYYEYLFAKRLEGDLPDAVRAQFEAALKEKRAAKYVAIERKILLTPF